MSGEGWKGVKAGHCRQRGKLPPEEPGDTRTHPWDSHLWLEAAPCSRRVLPCTLGREREARHEPPCPLCCHHPPPEAAGTPPGSSHSPSSPAFQSCLRGGGSPTASPPGCLQGPVPSLTSHPPVDGIGAVVVEKLRAGRLREGWREGGVRGRLLRTLRVAPPASPGEDTKEPTHQQGN